MYSVADICLKHQKPEMNLFNQTKSGGEGGKNEEERASKYERGCGNDYEKTGERKEKEPGTMMKK